jgi:glutathione S-transferase
MMKLYWGPFTCAIEIAALLDEANIPFEAVKLDTASGEHRKEPYTTMNPKGKIPALVRDDGSVITEYPAIAHWIAHNNPEAHLWPTESEDALHASQMMDYAIDTLHGQGFRRIFFPHEFCKDDAHKAAVRDDGKAIATKAFGLLSDQLGDRPYCGGETFSIADATIFYTTRWAKLTKVALPVNIAALAEKVGARPAFSKAVSTLV